MIMNNGLCKIKLFSYGLFLPFFNMCFPMFSPVRIHLNFWILLTSIPMRIFRVRQLCVELKYIKKDNSSIIEFILCVKAITNSLFTIGDIVSEQDQIDSIIDGFHEEYDPFAMQMYGTIEP